MIASVVLVLYGVDREKYDNIADDLSVNLWCDEISEDEGIIYLYDPDQNAEEVAGEVRSIVNGFGLVYGRDYRIYVEYNEYNEI